MLNWWVKILMKITIKTRAVLFVTCLIAIVSGGLAGPATVPYGDDFESYSNQTPLIDGLNGWYASDSSCIVQTNISYTNYGGTKAAMIPVDVTLSNRFADVPATSVWVRLYIRPVWYNGQTNPVVETNCATMFYVSNGYFVVHNGPADPDPTNSQNWVSILTDDSGAAATQLVEGAWARVDAYLDYPNTNWTLFVNGDKMMTNIGFIDTSKTNFNGFDVYNGNSTSYQDNVYVTQSKTLTIDGLVASNKVYDGDTGTAIDTNNLSLVGVEGSDDVTLVVDAATTGCFDTATIGVLKTVTVTGITLSGAQAANYSLVTTTVASITEKSLSIVGVTVSNKVYDSTTAAAISSTGTLTGVVGSDVCYLYTNSMSASFDTKDVGVGKTVTVTGIALAGVDSTNYSIASQTTATADITTNSSALSLTGLTADNKVYDGSNTAAISSYGSLVGVLGSDSVTLDSSSAGGYFADKNVGSGKTVTVTNLALSGADGANYSISNQTTTANITVRTLTLSDFTADNKEYDGTTAVTGTGFSDDRVSGDALTFSYSAAFASPNVGTQTVNYTSITINGGDDQSNYTLASTVGSTSAVISLASRTVTFTGWSQEYNTVSNCYFPGVNPIVSVGTGTWAFTVQSGPGTIVNGTNLLIGYTNVTVRATISATDTNAEAYADAVVTVVMSGSDGKTNSIPWSDNFESYYNGTPLINGITGWYASASSCIVQQDVKYSGTQAAMVPTDTTLSNRFNNAYCRLVRMEMYVQPQLYNGSNYPTLSTNVAAQFFINSNGYFVVSHGANWKEVTNMTDGTAAIPVTNTQFARIQLNLRYKNHTWNIKVWTNGTELVANTYYMNFTSNLNTFSGFDLYNGNATSYLDDVSVTNLDVSVLPKVNSVPVDIIKSINDAPPVSVNGIRIDGKNEW